MKKQIILLSTLYSFNLIAQDYCGFEHYAKQHPHSHQENPNNLANKKGDNIFHNLSKLSSQPSLLSTSSEFTPYSGPIYDIPVVVHIIESNSTEGITDNRTLKLTDDEVKNWIENTNKIYATTYGNGFFSEGPGQKDGAVIPFRLVLAQRDKNLKPTTGIYRYNGDDIPGYGLYGVKNGLIQLNAPSAGDIVAKYPHWQEDLYYNIYIVVGVDGNKQEDGPGGFAGLPSYPENGYHTFVPVSRVRRKNDTTLAHEFGHSLGLLHTFHGGSDTTCPTGDNDGVDDTEVITSFPCVKNSEGVCERPVNETDINPCTNQYFQGTQYNIMGYNYERKKFTVGQREKVINEFFKHNRSKNLAKSRGGEPITENSEIKLANTCIPNDFRLFGTPRKTRKITFGDIEINVNNSTFYTDYTSNSSFYKGSYTDLVENQSQTLTIESEIGNKFHAWIDYNNNGNFETNERITPNSGLAIPASKKVNLDITPSTNAVKNTYLRLRILTDAEENSHCADMYADGNINDFAVRIVEEKIVEPEPEPVPENPTPEPIPTPQPNTPTTPQEESYLGRVGINTAEPKATLDIREISLDQLPAGQSQGVLFPSFTSEERDKFQSVEEGTMIFNTTLKCLEIYKGSELKWQCVQ